MNTIFACAAILLVNFRGLSEVHDGSPGCRCTEQAGSHETILYLGQVVSNTQAYGLLRSVDCLGNKRMPDETYDRIGIHHLSFKGVEIRCTPKIVASRRLRPQERWEQILGFLLDQVRRIVVGWRRQFRYRHESDDAR